ncbi:hypothetical protein [Dokdonia sp.]|uniref:hypothetical protein n=1 Tax=Dokdonia sp. TaxID=2024995 RepID=UPI003267A34F
MGIFNNLFKKKEITPKIECPRCLGKGHVNEADIIRLDKELYWAPGDCAYCKKTGEVDASLVSKIAVDEMYLTIERTDRERKKIINKDKQAIAKAAEYKELIDSFVDHIVLSYTEKKASIDDIAETLLVKGPKGIDKGELVRYIKKIIEVKQL